MTQTKDQIDLRVSVPRPSVQRAALNSQALVMEHPAELAWLVANGVGVRDERDAWDIKTAWITFERDPEGDSNESSTPVWRAVLRFERYLRTADKGQYCIAGYDLDLPTVECSVPLVALPTLK